MNRPCNEFLARSCLPRYKNRGITWRDLGDARENRLQSRRGSNDLLKHRGFVDFLPEGDVFLLKPFLSPLAVFDIGTRSVATQDLSVVVAHRVVTSQKPTINSITSA